jgi:hypothetical protein
MKKILRTWREQITSKMGTINNWREKITSETGTIESALTMIPLLLLFLTILQISASVMGRTSALSGVQDQITMSSLYGSAKSANNDSRSLPPSLAPLTSIESLPLTGGGSLILGTRKAQTPRLTPLLLGQDAYSASGITVDESS